MTAEQEKLVIDNIGLAYKVALKGKYLPTRAFTTDEMIQTALLGLCIAAQCYDTTREDTAPFENFACRVMSNKIGKECYRIKLHCPKTISIYEEKTNDIYANIGEDDPGFEECEWDDTKSQLMRIAKDVLKNETERNRTVYRMYLEGKRHAEIGRAIGRSRPQASRICSRITSKIRSEYYMQIGEVTP